MVAWLEDTSAADTQVGSATRSTFIVHPVYDGVFFIGAPVIALIIGVLMADTAVATEPIAIAGQEAALSDLFIGTFIMAHLGLVVVRSHGNPAIFRLYPGRFSVVPAALLTAMLLSPAVMICVTVVATWWDVYHSGLQTFGLGRIYDRRAGNDPTVGRGLDHGLNLLLYVGPILGGATLIDHLDSFDGFADLGWMVLAQVPARAPGHQAWLTWVVVIGGAAYLLYYVVAYAQLARRGYKVSSAKIALFACTGLVSLYAWGFNSFGEAFFVMNFFHALQYFALVWWSEKGNLCRILGLHGRRAGGAMTWLVLLVLAFGYGVFANFSDDSNRPIICVTLTVSIMHFWYDGFIWSVRKNHV